MLEFGDLEIWIGPWFLGWGVEDDRDAGVISRFQIITGGAVGENVIRWV